MDLEKIKVLNEHLGTLEKLAGHNVAVYREINRVNAAIQQEINSYTPPGVSVNLQYQALNNSYIATWDEINNQLLVRGTLTPISDVLQYLRIHTREETMQSYDLTDVQFSNILCFAARVLENAVY